MLNDHMILFAQRGGDPAAMIIPMLIGCVELVIFAAVLAFQIYYLIVMYKALNAVSPENRDMEPAMIFLIFIPCFGIIWYFFIVTRLASSLEKEFDRRGLSGDGDFGRQIGIIAQILNLTLCLALGGLICMIIHMNKIKGYTLQLESGGKGGPRLQDDDDDDRPRKRRYEDET